MFLNLYPTQFVLLLLLSRFFSPPPHPPFDGPPGTAGLVTQHRHVSPLPLGVEVLRHAQQLQHLLRKLSPADIVTGEAKYTKNVFLHSSGNKLTCA